MKSFRLFLMICLAVVFAAISTAFQVEAPPFDIAASALVAIALTVGVVSAATLLAIRHLTETVVSTALSPLMRLAFPAPQTGTPPASVFA